MSDARIFGDSELFNGLEEEALGLPTPSPLTASPDDLQDIPFLILGDKAFAFRNYLMKPYGRRGMVREKRIFKYRLSRGGEWCKMCLGCLLRTLEQKPNALNDMVEAQWFCATY
ncbi:uncharacterized protein LOC115927624 [Strongylocentrotus purpuratus]|uniref:DDE Tnp4 domain-containing protein n=1 Tax=Strongylocentrotus purpuratus TaxID=7668 RepID=A0A7M7PCB9_STRPU|nr:uncharacterized protein LOC115927624 [Strongylocentrotus purpuratus]